MTQAEKGTAAVTDHHGDGRGNDRQRKDDRVCGIAVRAEIVGIGDEYLHTTPMMLQTDGFFKGFLYKKEDDLCNKAEKRTEKTQRCPPGHIGRHNFGIYL